MCPALGGHGEPVRHCGTHRAEHPHHRCGGLPGCPVEGQPQLVRPQQHPGGGVVDAEGVGPDRRPGVALPVDAGPLDVGVAGRPATHDVPRGLVAAGVAALHLHLDPGAGGGLRVPGGDQLGGVEPDPGHRRGPGAVLPGAGGAGVRVGVLGGAGRAGQGEARSGAGHDAGAGLAAPVPVGGPGPVLEGDLLVVGGGGRAGRRRGRAGGEQGERGDAGEGGRAQAGSGHGCSAVSRGHRRWSVSRLEGSFARCS